MNEASEKASEDQKIEENLDAVDDGYDDDEVTPGKFNKSVELDLENNQLASESTPMQNSEDQQWNQNLDVSKSIKTGSKDHLDIDEK